VAGTVSREDDRFEAVRIIAGFERQVASRTRQEGAQWRLTCSLGLEAGSLWLKRYALDGVNMNFHTRKWVKPEDLNPNGTLFGGSLLRWIDEEAAIYAIVQLGNQRVVTKYISEINFVSASRQGDIIELGITATEFGRTSITLTCQVRNKITRKSILTVDKLVFVNLGEDGLPAPHGKTEITYVKDQFKEEVINEE
jgi:acyl-CoA hydrolase